MFPWRGRGGWGGGGGGPNWGGGGGGQNPFGNFGPNTGPFGGFGGRGGMPFHQNQNRFAPPGTFRGGRGGFRGRGRGGFDGEPRHKVPRVEDAPQTETGPNNEVSIDQAKVDTANKQKETTPDGQTVKSCDLCDTKVVGEENYQLHLQSDAHKSKAASTAGPSGIKTEPAEDSSEAAEDVKTVVKVERAPALPCEEEPEYDDSLVLLDWYNSDLNLRINTDDFCSVTAMSQRGFGYMWAGVRATLGSTSGKVCFEVRVDSNQPTDHLEGEATPNVLRVGWSTDASSLQLGEDMFSYGYGGTAKTSVNLKFKDYGIRYGVGDVVGCYLDCTGPSVIMKFTVNGRDQGVAFRVSKQELKGQALFPHVLTKNQDFTVNFGQLPAPMQPLLPNFTPIGQLDVDDGLVRGQVAPPSRDACEALMMIGLPGAGKTHWAENWSKKHPEKRYNIMGTNNLIDKMKVMGLSRKKNYHGRWDLLIKKCTDCFEEMLKMAAKRRRNYILDQTNVFPTARPRKLKPFNGFETKAVVVVPDDEEFRRRIAEREAVEGKEVPDAAVLNMKANFVLPETEEDFFSEVLYVEQGPEDAERTINAYVEEAGQAGVRPTAGVKTFKNRCAMKRQRNRIPIPGRLLRDEAPLMMKPEPELPALPVPCKLEPPKPPKPLMDIPLAPPPKFEPKIEPVQVKEEVASGSGEKTGEEKGKIRDRDSNSSRDKKRSRTRSRERRRGGDSTDARRRTRSRDRRRSRSRSRDRRRNRSRDRRDNQRKDRDSQDRRDRRRSRSRDRRRDEGRTNQGMGSKDGPTVSPWMGGNAPFRVKSEDRNMEGEDRMGPGGAMRSNFGPGGSMRGNFGPGGPMGGNMGPGGPMSRNMGQGLMGSGGPMGTNMGPRSQMGNNMDQVGSMDGNMGPRGQIGRNMGPGGPMADNMGPGGQMGRNMGPGGPRSDNIGPRDDMRDNMGPGGPMRDDIGPGGHMRDIFGPGGPMRGDMGPASQMERNMGPGGPMRDNMGPGGRMRDNMGPGGPIREGMGPGGLLRENMGPGGPMRENMGTAGPMRRNMGAGGPMIDNMVQEGSVRDTMGPGGPFESNMGPKNPMIGNMAPGGSMGRNMGPRESMSGNVGPGSNEDDMDRESGFMGPGGNMNRGGPMMGRGGGNMGRGASMGQPGFGSMPLDGPASIKPESGIRNSTGLLGAGPGPSAAGDNGGMRGSGLLGQGPNSSKSMMQNEDSYKQEDMDLEMSEERDIGPPEFGNKNRFGESGGNWNNDNSNNRFNQKDDQKPFMGGPNQRNDPNPFMGGPNQRGEQNPFMDGPNHRNNRDQFMRGPNQREDQNPFIGGPDRRSDENPFMGGPNQRNDQNQFMGRPNQRNDQNNFMGESDRFGSEGYTQARDGTWSKDSSGFDNEPLEPVDDEDLNYDKSSFEGGRGMMGGGRGINDNDGNMRGNHARGGFGGNRSFEGNDRERFDNMRGPAGRFNDNENSDFNESQENVNENRDRGFNETLDGGFNEHIRSGFNENRGGGFRGGRDAGLNENRSGFNENFDMNRRNNEDVMGRNLQGNDGPVGARFGTGRFGEPSGNNANREGFDSNRNIGPNENRGNIGGRMFDNPDRGMAEDGGRMSVHSQHSHHSQGEGRRVDDGGRAISSDGRMNRSFEDQERTNQQFSGMRPNDNMMGQRRFNMDGPQGRNVMGEMSRGTDDNMRFRENSGPVGTNIRDRNPIGPGGRMGPQMENMGGPNQHMEIPRGNEMFGQRREMMDQSEMFQRRDALDRGKEFEPRVPGGRPGQMRGGSPGRREDGFGGHASQSDIGSFGQRRDVGRESGRDGTQSDLGQYGSKVDDRFRDERQREEKQREDKNRDKPREREDRRDRDDRRERDDKRDDRRDRDEGRNRDAGRRDGGRRDRDHDRGRDQERDRDRGRGRDKPDELVDRRSAGDRKLERDMAKGQFDNGVRMANPMGSRFPPPPPSSRLNVESNTIPGMNPPAPDPSPSGSFPVGYPDRPGMERPPSSVGAPGPSGYPPGGPGAPGYPPGGPGDKSEGGSGPDYAALLQYLQYYQKQMGGEEGEQK